MFIRIQKTKLQNIYCTHLWLKTNDKNDDDK